MALIDVNVQRTWRDAEEVELRLAAFRAAIDDARRNSWCEGDHLGDEMESYLELQQPVLPAITRPQVPPTVVAALPDEALPPSLRNNWRQ